MLEVALLGTVVVMAGVGLHQRKGQKEGSDQDAPPPQTPKRLQQKSTDRYLLWCAVPLLLVLSVFAASYWVAPEKFQSLISTRCWSETPMNMARSWDYSHGVPALQNVSDSDDAQRLFNQGLLLRFGYSLENARDAFSAALKLDPSCAMCYWGMAYSNAPFANIVALPDTTRYPHFSDAMNTQSREFLETAMEMPMRSAKAKDYIRAMQIRFQSDPVERSLQEWWEFVYGAKMLTLWKQDPADLVAGSLAAEAFVNCMPWDYYELEADSPQSFEESITWRELMDVTFSSPNDDSFGFLTDLNPADSVLDMISLKPESLEKKVRDHRMRPLARVIEHLILKILEVDDAHPMATHLHIHLIEASMANDPRKALHSALKLSDVSQQWKSAHLIHMPSHIFLRVGEYKKGVTANEAAYKIDIETSQRCMDPYLPEHNLKVLIASASMGGLFDKAEEYSIRVRTMMQEISRRMYVPPGWDYVTLLEVWGHFGKWEKIVAADPPSVNARGSGGSGGLEFATAMYHFYRYMALSHVQKSESRKLLNAPSMEEELQLFEEAATKVIPVGRTFPGAGIGIYSAAYYEKTKIASLYAQARNATIHGDIVSFPQSPVRSWNSF